MRLDSERRLVLPLAVLLRVLLAYYDGGLKFLNGSGFGASSGR